MLQANLRCSWYAWCCAVLAGQGSACRKPLLADILSSCANHSHFELQSLIWLLQSISNYVDANYCPYFKSAFSHVFLSKKERLLIWNTRGILFLGYFCHGPTCKRCRADSHQISEEWGFCLDSSLFLLSKFHWAKMYLNTFTFKIISDMPKCEDNNSSLVFLIFSHMIPKDSCNWLKLGMWSGQERWATTGCSFVVFSLLKSAHTFAST